MVKFQPNLLKKIGIPMFAAGFVLFMSPDGTNANEAEDTEISFGDTGEQVEELQELLHDKGLLEEDKISGDYKESTKKAIEDFQEEHHLNIDGIAGPNTIGALEVLEKGDEGAPVQSLQEKLNVLGYYGKQPDGIFGPITYDAVINFQRSASIAVDGLAGPQTFGALVEAINTPGAKSTTAKEPAAPKQETKAAASAPKTAPEKAERPDSSQAQGRSLQVNATAYTADCNGCSGITATGVNLNANRHAKVIAVDPNVIPLGSKVHVEGYGTYTAADTGGAINGNRIDIHMPSKSQALNFGRRSLQVTILN
ncbi:peptidoglycan-binding protein [Bacillus piscicola]|uniref:peptidoglycan-binding protein n=1 Tax=Bacillus piscicola TaxID=1632684 RepID=UPI001F096FC3|nr:peptidoglycan-binding protein [Bacillus piscicola]